MPTLVPVDNDPFATPAAPNVTVGGQPKLVPVDHDPFASGRASMTPAQRAESPSPEDATPATPNQPSHLERIGREALSPVLGLEQLAGRVLPIPAYNGERWTSRAATDDAAVKTNEDRIKAARSGDKGPNWERMAIDAVNPVNYLPAVGVAAIPGLAAKAAAPLAGAVSALTQPVIDGGNFLWEKATQAVEGAIGGRAVSALPGLISPQLTGASRTLSDLGVRLTPGQMAGGAGKRAEDAISSIPFVGSMIRDAQRTSIEDFNHAAINHGLQSIGGAIPRDIPAGRPAIQYMANTISDAYQRVLPQMVGQIDHGFQADLVNVAALGRNLPPELEAQLHSVIRDDVVAKFSQGGGISGQTAQDIGSDLDNLANTMRRSESPDVRRLGTAVQEIDASINRMMERTNPTLAPEKLKIDQAWAHYKTIERAAAMQGAKDGVFTPAQLSNSVRSRDTSKDKSAYAKGDAMMQDLASAAERVLPQKVPDSGTAERATWAGVVGGSWLESPHLALGLGASSLPYTTPGLAAARAYTSPGAARTAASALGARYAPAAAAPAAQIFEDATP